jgi:hypothetical protein
MQSILTTVFTSLCCCFLPIGVIPLIFSIQTDSKWKIGDVSGALASSRQAKIWNWVALGCIIFGVLIRVGMTLLQVVTLVTRN